VSPFNLTGPQFLLFYIVFAGLVLGAYAFYLSSLGSTATPRLSELTADPYRIVFLRAGREEVVRVAVVNLVDRGLLEAAGNMLRTVRDSATAFVRRDLDRAILNACASSKSCGELETHPGVRAALVKYESELARNGLILSGDEQESRRIASMVVVALLGGLAAARIWQALSRGQTNIAFLLMLAVAACLIGLKLFPSRATPSGRRALASLRTLTQRVARQIERLKPGGETNEALLMAAVLGIYALPSIHFGFIENLYPRPRPGSSSCGSGGDGGSCGGGGGGCGGCGGGGGD